MGFATGPKIVTDGLVLALDAASPRSYPGTGTTWYDLTANSLDATLYNGVAYSTDNHGIMVFDGVDDYAQISSSPLTAINVFTFELWFNRTDIATTTPPYDRIFQKEGGTSGYPAWGWSIGESVSVTPQFLSAYGDGTTLNNTINFNYEKIHKNLFSGCINFINIFNNFVQVQLMASIAAFGGQPITAPIITITKSSTLWY